MMAIAGIIPVAKWLAKIKQRSDVGCRLCKRAREQRGASTGNLPEETYGHIRGKKGFVRDLAHTQKKNCQEKPIFTNLKIKIRAHRASSKATRLFLKK